MPDRPRLLLLIPHLGGGGAERVFDLIARQLPTEKYEIHVGLVTQACPVMETLPASVMVHAIGAARVRSAGLALIRVVRQIRPALILSTMAHLNFLVLALRPMFPRGTRILVRQNGTASAMLKDLRCPAWTRTLYQVLYPRADRVLCQSLAMAQDLLEFSRVSEERIALVPNPVDLSSIRRLAISPHSEWNGPGPHLLAVGRLRHEKGFDTLLNAFRAVRDQIYSADLTIAGDGPEEARLKQLCRSLALEGDVRFTGYVPAPSRYFPGASLFVLPSRHEGMPNALLEAAAGGLPIVTTPACEGLVELLHGDGGSWVAEGADEHSLAQTLIAALTELQPGQRFPHPWVEQFSLENALAAYQVVIDDALGIVPEMAFA
ncbi:MAG: glycosyltransferase [Terracidiphilus sp.]|nr:glycosyltransferase [Terracidiphilus sp.]